MTLVVAMPEGITSLPLGETRVIYVWSVKDPKDFRAFHLSLKDMAQKYVDERCAKDGEADVRYLLATMVVEEDAESQMVKFKFTHG
jgi:hypothetical protein